MVPSKIKIESFAKRYHMGTLGGKGFSKAMCARATMIVNPHCSMKFSSQFERLARYSYLTKKKVGSRILYGKHIQLRFEPTSILD